MSHLLLIALRAKVKARPKFPVPTDRMKHNTAVKALRAVCTLSRGGAEPVSADQLGANLNLAATTAGLNNSFFASVGLVTREGKAGYKPTEIALEIREEVLL